MFYISMSYIWNSVDALLFISALFTFQFFNIGLLNGKNKKVTLIDLMLERKQVL